MTPSDELDLQVSEFLKAFERTHFLEKHRMLTRFIQDRLDIRDKEYSLSNTDLAYIHSMATDYGRQYDSKDNVKFMTLAWTNAVLMFLRSKNMLSYIIKGENK